MTTEVARPTLVLTHPSGLRQILTNLVGNAIAYNKPGGSVHVTTSATRDEFGQSRVRIRVRDTGPGLTIEQQGEVFKPFVGSPDRRSGARASGCRSRGRWPNATGACWAWSPPPARAPSSGWTSPRPGTPGVEAPAVGRARASAEQRLDLRELALQRPQVRCDRGVAVLPGERALSPATQASAHSARLRTV